VRVTQQAQRETRTRILEAARRLFRTQGFEATTTRDLASEAHIATGTLFNYFPTKEAIVMTFVAEALDAGRGEYAERRREKATLEEDLFDLIAAGLRKLKPHRSYLRVALETAFGPAARSRSDAGGELAESVRVNHLEAVQESLTRHGAATLPPLALQLYWTLYCGVLAHWIDDRSAKQEDTLALLDQSLKMFIRWLSSERDGTKPQS
jgi:AcrR family transcriptional regulator